MADTNNGIAATKLADSVWLLLASRLISVVGVPMAGFIFFLLWSSVQSLQQEVRALSTQLQVLNERMTALKDGKADLDNRVKEIERRAIGARPMQQ